MKRAGQGWAAAILAVVGGLVLASAYAKETRPIQLGEAEAHFNLGVALLQKGQLDRAIQELQEGLQLQPDFLDGALILDHLRFLKKQHDDARQHFERQFVDLRQQLQREFNEQRKRIQEELEEEKRQLEKRFQDRMRFLETRHHDALEHLEKQYENARKEHEERVSDSIRSISRELEQALQDLLKRQRSSP